MGGLRRVALAGVVCVALMSCWVVAASAAPVSSGHSGWSWALPTPQGQNLSDVTFDGSTGYAAGDFGTVLKSTDGGQTWSGLPSGTTSNLSIVEELDPNTVIVGGGCALRESTNGGATFTPMPINPSDTVCGSDIVAISFSSASTGYVLLQSGQVLYTTNAGATVTAKTQVPLPAGNTRATGLTFVTATTGFATTTGGTIERTTDGGNSWTQVINSLFGLNGISFITAQTAFAFGPGNVLLKSTDGGATWTLVPLTLTSSAVDNLTGIACSTPTTCLISTGTSSLILTSDGGQTGSLVTPSNQTLASVAFTTGAGVVAVGGAGTTVLSSDGGAQFPTLVSGGPGVPVSSGAKQPLVAGGSGSAYLLGKNGQLDVTTDGGAAWSLAQTPTNANVLAAAFPTSTGYVVTGDRVLRKTTDGGNSWSSLDATVTNQTQLAATSAGTVMLVGPQGIRRSTNGGQTFAKVAGRVQLTRGRHGATVASLALTGAAVHGSTTFAWGLTGAYESTDRGVSWRAIPLPHKTKIKQLSFVSPTTGYVLDVAGDVLFTSNRGGTWRKLANTGSTAIAGISFSSAQRGLLALTAPDALTINVLSTTNGGRKWQPQVIDGSGFGAVLATPAVGYFTNISPAEDPYHAMFTTTNAGASPKSSTLTLSLPARKLTAAALRKRGGRITIRGRLSPVTSPGEQVLFSFRSRQTGGWTSRTVAVASNGAFQTTVSKLKATTDFVVYSTGDGTYGGAQGYARLTVK